MMMMNDPLPTHQDDEEGGGGVDEKELLEEDPREHLNLVFIGHVDAGKSTMSGQLLYLTGQVSSRRRSWWWWWWWWWWWEEEEE